MRNHGEPCHGRNSENIVVGLVHVLVEATLVVGIGNLSLRPLAEPEEIELVAGSEGDSTLVSRTAGDFAADCVPPYYGRTV